MKEDLTFPGTVMCHCCIPSPSNKSLSTVLLETYAAFEEDEPKLRVLDCDERPNPGLLWSFQVSSQIFKTFARPILGGICFQLLLISYCQVLWTRLRLIRKHSILKNDEKWRKKVMKFITLINPPIWHCRNMTDTQGPKEIWKLKDGTWTSDRDASRLTSALFRDSHTVYSLSEAPSRARRKNSHLRRLINFFQASAP